MAKVMIVDDDRTMVRLLATLLEMDGYEVVQTAHNVLQTIRAERPDLVLMDVFLTNADGLELLTEIRSSSDLVDLPVVMTSGMDVSDKAASKHASAFLLKPYTPEQLAEVIEGNLGDKGHDHSAPSQE